MKKGFSLIELLVVIAIVIAIIGILCVVTAHACGSWFDASCDSASGQPEMVRTIK